ncbi:MAG: hypothetical protein RMK29_17760 [Myxococcales bacterium]|nr:hypothetical protein [Myxococcota bacterium]MDW8283557.1 hypothetical protein [Myxococcales bacterium]
MPNGCAWHLSLLLGLGCMQALPTARVGRQEAIDIDGMACRAMAQGSARVRGGALFFEASGPPLLLPVAVGPGRFGRLVAELGGTRALAVRSGSGPEEEVVVIDPEQPRPQRLWSHPGAVRLLGRAGQRLALLVADGPAARVAVLDVQRRTVLRSRLLPVAAAVWQTGRLEAGLPHAAPLGPGGWLLLCKGGLCRVQLHDDRIEVQQVPLPAQALGLWRGRLLVRLDDRRCVELSERASNRWPRGRADRCPPELAAGWEPAAPQALVAEGALTGDTQLVLPACLVRGELDLPPAAEHDEAWADNPRSGARVLLLGPPQLRWGEAELNLAVAGSRFSASFRPEEGASDLPRLFRLPIPPGAATVTRQDGGLLRLRLRLPLPRLPCLRGHLVLSAGQADHRGDQAALEVPFRSAGC